MPELPDVAVYRKLLDATSLQRTIEQVSFSDSRILRGVSVRKFSDLLKGNRFERSLQHGKNLLVELSGGSPHVWLHFGMTGALHFLEKHEKEPAYTRCVFTFSGGDRLAVIDQRLLGKIGVVESPESFSREKGLGPHALGEEMNAERFIRILSGRKGMIKTALMNQSVIAGIGNIYADEILYQASIHPESDVRRLDEATLRDLHTVMKRVLRTAVEKGADAEKLPRDFLMPNRRAGTKCPRCRGSIEKIRVHGRGTYLCPRCQKRE
ncbi:MAG: DNA-formamidopyrimidine glycosylase family protein [Nitrospirota bacterium]